MTDLCGSPHYMAPELIGQQYTHSVDVWALGILLYLIMYGRYPYDARNPRDVMVKILTDVIQWSNKHVELSRNCLDLLKHRLLQRDPQQRITAELGSSLAQQEQEGTALNAVEKKKEKCPGETLFPYAPSMER